MTTHRFSHLPLIILLALVAFVIIERWSVPRPPFGIDVMAYAVIGHELLDGRLLYSDLWDHKPPAIYATYAGAESLVGYGPQILLLLNIVATLLTLLGAYRAGKAGGSVAAGLWAAAFWAVLSGTAVIEGRDPNSEFFINPCLMWAFALLAEANDRLLGVRRALLVGALFALGSFYKPVVVAAAVMLACVHVWLPPAARRGRAALDVLVMGGVGFVAWCIMFGYFAATNRSAAFREAVITYNSYYAGNVLANLILPLRGGSEFKLLLMSLLGVTLLVGAALTFISNRRAGALLAALTLATWVMVASPGKFYAHYFQLWLVPLAVGAGWTIVRLASHTPANIRWLPRAAGAFALASLLALQLPFYRRAWSRNWIDPTILNLNVAEPLGHNIDRLLAPDETFLVWGSEPGLYFWSRRHPPVGFFFLHHLLGGPLAAQLSTRAAADLARARPELLVVSKKAVSYDAPPPAWITEDYRPLPNDLQMETHTLLARPGGKLAARIAAKQAEEQIR